MGVDATHSAAHASRGGEAHLGVSHAAGDVALATTEIERLRALGYRLSPGPGGPPAGAEAGCAMLVALLTPRAARDAVVRQQISDALDQGIALLAIHLERTDLPSGLRLQIASYQAILKWEMDEASYLDKLVAALPTAARAGGTATTAYHQARLRELSALKRQRELRREEWLEVATHLRALGDDRQAGQAEAAAARARPGAATAPSATNVHLARDDRSERPAPYHCPRCGAPYHSTYRTRCGVCGTPLSAKPLTDQETRPTSQLRLLWEQCREYMTPLNVTAVVCAVIVVVCFLYMLKTGAFR